MIGASIRGKHAGEKNWDPMGEFSFAVLPRVGEVITKDDANGIGQAYRVLAVHHPDSPTSLIDPGVDIFVVHVGKTVDESIRLFRES